MPPEFGHAKGLDRRLDQLAPRLAVDLDVETRTRLLAYLGLIQRWTQVYNLTAVRDSGEMFTHHLLDCLAVVAPLRRGIGRDAAVRVLDVGSGAGLPGAIVALLNPGW